MVANLTAPDALLQPFASNGDKNTIPLAATGTQAASLDEGFPPITSTSILEGGIPPQRTDFNGLGYLLSSQFFYLQNGGNFTFNQAVSDAIGGYPQGAILNWEDTSTGAVHRVKSLIPNNIYNFVTTPSYVDGEKWEIVFREIPSQTGNAGKVLSTNGTTLSWEENITGAATTIKSDDLTASRALISNTSGKVAVSAATSTELGYLSGVTSAIQTQLNGKQASGSYVTTDTAQTVSAIKTFSAIPKISATIGSTDNSTNVPTTAWTRSLITSIMNTSGLFCTTSVSGTTWFREWKNSSGTRVWLEQGGRVGTRSRNGEVIVTLPKAFSNTNYTVVQSNITTYKENESGVIMNITSTSFGIFAWAARGSTWYACGK